MSRSIFLAAALLFGCSDDPTGPDPKTETACAGTWSVEGYTGESCDLGCEGKPTDEDLTGGACDTNVSDPNGDAFRCDATFNFSGQRGCCIDIDPAGPTKTLKSGIPNEPARSRDVFFLTCH